MERVTLATDQKEMARNDHHHNNENKKEKHSRIFLFSSSSSSPLNSRRYILDRRDIILF
jgi:hypothetical protein